MHPVLGPTNTIEPARLVVTSSSAKPCSSNISSPTLVSRPWNAGRQCMNFVEGLPVAFMSFELTWYGVSSLIR